MKQIFTICLIVLSAGAFSQAIVEPTEVLTPDAGEVLIEITTSPFNRDGSGGALLNFGQLRGRYFLSDVLVPRLGFSYSVDDNNEINFNLSPVTTTTVSQFTIMPGIEYHLINEGGSGGFTSYAAVDLIFESRSAQAESSIGSSVEGATFAPSSPTSGVPFDARGYSGFGFNLAVGGEYYFSSKFYAGAEIGFRWITGSTADIEVDGELVQEGTDFSEGGMNTTNVLRIGFKLL